MNDVNLVLEAVCRHTNVVNKECQVRLADGRVVIGSPVAADDFSLPGFDQAGSIFYDRFYTKDYVQALLTKGKPFITSVFSETTRRRYAMRWSIASQI